MNPDPSFCLRILPWVAPPGFLQWKLHRVTPQRCFCPPSFPFFPSARPLFVMLFLFFFSFFLQGTFGFPLSVNLWL